MRASIITTVKIDGVERELECKASGFQGSEPDVGIMHDCVEEWIATHWSECRELTQAEYDKISDEENERILEELDEALEYDDEPRFRR